VYKLVYKITSFGDSVPVSSSLGGMSRTNSFAATTTKTILMGSYNTNSLNLSVTALANYDVYMDDVSVKEVTDGDAWIADELHVGTAISLNGERITAWGAIPGFANLASTQALHTTQINSNVVHIANLQTTQALHTTQIASNDAEIVDLQNEVINLATTQQTVKATADSAMQDLVDDTTPTLGGPLQGNNKSVSAVTTVEATVGHLAPLFQASTGGSGYLFQSDNDVDVGTATARARVVYCLTNIVTRVQLADGVYVEAVGTTNFLFTAGTNSAIIGWE